MRLDFDGDTMKVQEDYIKARDGGRIPIVLFARKDPESSKTAEGCYYEVVIDGEKWLTCDTIAHGIVIYRLLRDYVTDYIKGGIV